MVFACVHNAGRSQMAAALFAALADPAMVRADSAGTTPAAMVHPVVVATMAELHIDLRSTRPQPFDAIRNSPIDLLITMGCGDACPVAPGTRVLDWPLRDPRDRPVDEVREIRDEIRERVRQLVLAEGWARP